MNNREKIVEALKENGILVDNKIPMITFKNKVMTIKYYDYMQITDENLRIILNDYAQLDIAED